MSSQHPRHPQNATLERQIRHQIHAAVFRDVPICQSCRIWIQACSIRKRSSGRSRTSSRRTRTSSQYSSRTVHTARLASSGGNSQRNPRSGIPRRDAVTPQTPRTSQQRRSHDPASRRDIRRQSRNPRPLQNQLLLPLPIHQSAHRPRKRRCVMVRP